jgi:hypothetical protein
MARGDKSKGVTNLLTNTWSFIAWLTGVIVSFAVAFGLISGTLGIPLISDIGEGIITVTAGWIVVVLTTLGIVLKILDKIFLKL